MISPNRSNRKQKTQDGTPTAPIPAQMEDRTPVFAWMQNYRRLVTRWEYHIENFLGFVQLACLLMLLYEMGSVNIYEMAGTVHNDTAIRRVCPVCSRHEWRPSWLPRCTPPTGGQWSADGFSVRRRCDFCGHER
jgi:hypothetical protein